MKAPLPAPQLRLPASTPRVSRSAVLHEKAIIAIDGAQFADDRRRLVVGTATSDEVVDALSQALIEIEHQDSMVRFFKDVLAAPVEDGRGAV